MKMLCRRMHLTERHIQPPKLPSEGPIIRPCSNKKETPASPAPSVKPRSTDISAKTPLMIVDINMSPETKTMVQKDIKKDPKRPPPFCKQYQSNSKLSLFHDDYPRQNIVPQLLVKGVPIKNDDTISHQQTVDDADEESIINDFHPIPSPPASETGSADLCSSSESIADNASIVGHHTNCINTPLAVQEFILNLDQYGMDKDGCLPGLTRATSPRLGVIMPSQPPPSPSTRQIIRVDVTVNREKQESEKFKQMCAGISNGHAFAHRTVVRDKKGRLKFNASTMM